MTSSRAVFARIDAAQVYPVARHRREIFTGGRGAAALVTPVVLVLQFTSGVFFVFSDLPQWMQNFASIFPLKWMTQAMRSVFLPDSAAAMEVNGSWELGMTAVVLLIWIALGVVLANIFFRWTPRGKN